MKKSPMLIFLMALIFLGQFFERSQHAATALTEEITFNFNKFNIVGELKFPEGKEPHGAVIFVHGDGPNDRTSGGSYPPIMQRMLQAGYATFAWDKPGTGKSTGKLIRSDLFNQRAGIVLRAIEILKKHPSIDDSRIGLWGISQAGYVMARVLEKNQAVAFMIAVSCPGESSVAQTSYLISRQAVCAGIDTEEANKIERLYEAAERAQTYEEYARYKSQICHYPALEKMGIKMRVKPGTEWEKPDLNSKYFFDPMPLIEKLHCPVLVFFGERDTQADPVQGMAAWRKALEKAADKNNRIELIPGVDHCMFISKTGCLKEVFNRKAARYEKRFLDIIEEWLKKLGKIQSDQKAD